MWWGTDVNPTSIPGLVKLIDKLAEEHANLVEFVLKTRIRVDSMKGGKKRRKIEAA